MLNSVSKATNGTITCLSPVLPEQSRLLILGSIPGAVSLQRQQYYAHPRNVFWPVIAACLGKPLPQDYPERLQLLHQAGIALWDVLAGCRRTGSLDTAIRNQQVNNFQTLLQTRPMIRQVLLNGGTAYTLYRRHVAPQTPAITLRRLPSTSPAHAAMSTAEKTRHWQRAINAALNRPAA